MATRDGNIEYDKHFVLKHIWKISSLKKYKDISIIKEFLMDSVKLGLIDRTPVTEQYTAEVINCRVISEDGRDLDNDGDVKTGTPTLTSHGKSYSALIGGLKNKIGDLYIIVFEPITEKFYYFHILRKDYIQCSRDLRIPFNFDGSPNLENHWWDNETNEYFK